MRSPPPVLSGAPRQFGDAVHDLADGQHPGDGRDQHERQTEQVEPFFLKKCFQSCSSSPVCRLVVTHSVAHGGGIYARRGQLFCRPALQGPGVGFGWSAACARGGFPIRPVCGGRERPPYGAGGNTAATRENAISAAIANQCRGRCSHCARRRVSEANRTAGPALRPEIVSGCLRRRGVRGRGMPLPYTPSGTTGQMGLPRPPGRT